MAGELVQEATGFRFTYRDNYQGPPLSLSLPVSQRIFHCATLHPFFVSLAPVYDFVSGAPYPAAFNSGFLALPLLRCEEGEQDRAPGLKTQYAEYLGKDFLMLGEAMGLARAVVLRLFAQMQKEAVTVEKVYRASFMPESDVARILQCYQHRLHRMMNVDEVEL